MIFFLYYKRIKYNYIVWCIEEKIDLKYYYLHMIFWDLIVSVRFHNLMLKQKHVKINKKLIKVKLFLHYC